MLLFQTLFFLLGLVRSQYTKHWDPAIHILLRPGYNINQLQRSDPGYYDATTHAPPSYTKSYQTSPYITTSAQGYTSPYSADYLYQRTTPHQSPTYNPLGSSSYGSSIYSLSSDSNGYHRDSTPYSAGYNYNENYNYNSSRNQNSNYGYGSLYPTHCDDYTQRRINSCAYVLAKVGVFEQQTVGVIEKLTMSNFFRRTRDDFLNICDAYNQYNQCVGSASMKEQCYSREPYRTRYAPADNALSFACGEGYPSLFTSWQCIQEVSSGAARMHCINAVKNIRYKRQSMNYQQLANPYGICSALQGYIRCMRRTVEEQCGRHAYYAFLMTIRHSGETVFPYCTLSASIWHIHSATLLLISFISAYFASVIII